MGILDNVSGLEDMVSGGEEKPRQKAAKAEPARNDSHLNSRLEKIEGSVRSLKEAFEDLKNNIGKEKGGAGKNNLQDILRRLDEMESGAPTGGKDYSADIAELRKSVSEVRSIIASTGRSGEPAKAPAKDLLELKSRMDVLQKYVDGRMSALQVPQKEGAGRATEEAMNSRLNELSRRIDEIPKYGSAKTAPASSADRNIDDKLKLFALNSDVEKVWKETESLKRYVDEKTRMADGLANSLRAWETRNMQLMEKEHDFDEKISAFPELKMLESRIRKMERALAELQRHFVAAQITEPIIME